MKMLLIYNSKAAGGRAGKLYPEVKAALIGKGIDYDELFTEYRGHGVDLVKESSLGSYNGIIAAGGDGTLFEVINGYYKNPAKKKPPLGILPIGTGNAFARDLGLDAEHWRDAIEILSLKHPRKVDVGHFNTHGEDYYYLNILGLGFVADVTKTAHNMKFLGNVSYTLGVLYETLRLGTHALSIIIDGKKLEQENVFVEISNTRWTSNFLMAPDAKIDDGLLDVTLCGRLTRRQLLKAFPKIFTGDHLGEPFISQMKAKNISITTSVPKVLTPDGELLGATPIVVECLHKGVEVFWK